VSFRVASFLATIVRYIRAASGQSTHSIHCTHRLSCNNWRSCCSWRRSKCLCSGTPRHHNHLADARMQWNMQHAPRPYPIPSQATLAYRSAKRRAAALGCNRAALASVPPAIVAAILPFQLLQPRRCGCGCTCALVRPPRTATVRLTGTQAQPRALMSVALCACSVDDQTMIACWNPPAHPPSTVPQPAAGEHGVANFGAARVLPLITPTASDTPHLPSGRPNVAAPQSMAVMAAEDQLLSRPLAEHDAWAREIAELLVRPCLLSTPLRSTTPCARHAGTRHALCTHLRFCLHVCTFGDTPASSLHRTARAACRGPFLTAFPLSRCADECSMQLCVCRCPSLARPLRPSPRKIMIRCRPFQTRPQYACIRQPRQSWRRQRSGFLPRQCCPTLRQRTRTRRRPPRLPTL